MAKILVTPVASSGVAPFEVEGIIIYMRETDCFYHECASYPAEIVTVLED